MKNNETDILMGKAVRNVSKLLGQNDAVYWRDYFEILHEISGINRKFKRIADANDAEQLEDYLAEILYAIIFKKLSFGIKAEPLGEKGPDYEISRDSHNVYLEVSRFHEMYPGAKDLSKEKPVLEIYGNPKRDVNKAFVKILEKLRQVNTNESIIAIWNDDKELEEDEMKEAVEHLRDDVIQNNKSPSYRLLFVVYSSKLMRSTNRQRIYCFPSLFTLEPIHERWMTELERSSV